MKISKNKYFFFFKTAKKGRRAAKNPEPQRSFAGDETEELNIEGFDFNKSPSKSVRKLFDS